MSEKVVWTCNNCGKELGEGEAYKLVIGGHGERVCIGCYIWYCENNADEVDADETPFW